MKKKLLVLLSSVLAGAGLVGATFAAWAITDSADPLGIKISPTAISEDTDTFSTMHLEWGEKASFTNIANLALDQVKEVSLGIKSTVHAEGSDNASGGNLVVTLEDYTANHVQGAPKLIDNLVIKVYTGKEAGQYVGDPVITLDGAVVGNSNIETPTNGSEKTIYFTVEIKNTVTAVQYNQMQNDVVYLFADWNKPTGIVEVDFTRYYFKANEEKLGTSGTPRAYAFTEEQSGITKNADWPGVEMSVYNSNEHVYYVDIENDKFENIIFSYGASAAYQSADLDLPAKTTTTPLYNGTTWVANTYDEDVVAPQYYLVGNITNWGYVEQYLLSDPTDGVYTIDITTPNEGLVYKVRDKISGTWYSYTETGGDNCTWNQGNTEIRISFSPTKSLSEGSNYITAVAKNA